MNEVSRQGLNVNTASRDELTSIPGIGPGLAERIEQHRPYLAEEDLLEVNGIGPVLLDRIRPMLSFSTIQADSTDPEGELPIKDDGLMTIPSLLSDGESGELPADPTAGEPPVMSAGNDAKDDTPAFVPTDALEGSVDISSAPVKYDAPDPEPEEPGETPEPVTPASGGKQVVSRSSMMWLLAGTSFASVIASVLATLLVMVLINGTLRIDRHEGVVQLNRQVQNLSGDLEVLAADLGVVGEKLAALEGLSGRMTTVEGEIVSIQGQVDQAAEDVLAMQAEVQTLNETTTQLRSRVSQYDTFFEGLEDLIGVLFGRPAPQAE